MNTGLDPELLTINNGVIVPASFFLDDVTVNRSLSFDNAAVEIRPEHSDNLDILRDNTVVLLHEAQIAMRLARRRRHIPANSKLSFVPAARLHDKVRNLDSVQEFGCSPSQIVLTDYSTRTMKLVCGPETPYRSAGFHIHQELSHNNTVQAVVAVLDGLLGLRDVMSNHHAGWSYASRIRRHDMGYGRAGEYRIRPSRTKDTQILEYRVMSPWPLSEPKHIKWATSVVKAVCERPLDTLIDVLDAYPDRRRITKLINHEITNHTETRSLCISCVEAWTTHKNGR